MQGSIEAPSSVVVFIGLKVTTGWCVTSLTSSLFSGFTELCEIVTYLINMLQQTDKQCREKLLEVA